MKSSNIGQEIQGNEAIAFKRLRRWSNINGRRTHEKKKSVAWLAKGTKDDKPVRQRYER